VDDLHYDLLGTRFEVENSADVAYSLAEIEFLDILRKLAFLELRQSQDVLDVERDELGRRAR